MYSFLLHLYTYFKYWKCDKICLQYAFTYFHDFDQHFLKLLISSFMHHIALHTYWKMKTSYLLDRYLCDFLIICLNRIKDA